MLAFGLISSVFDLIAFAVLLQVFHADQGAFQTSWLMISLLTELLVVLILRTRLGAFQSRPSPLLLWSTLAVVTATLVVPYLGEPSRIFGLVPLSTTEIGTVLTLACGHILGAEFGKCRYFRSRGQKVGMPATGSLIQINVLPPKIRDVALVTARPLPPCDASCLQDSSDDATPHIGPIRLGHHDQPCLGLCRGNGAGFAWQMIPQYLPPTPQSPRTSRRRGN